jgi:hypothetical protein
VTPLNLSLRFPNQNFGIPKGGNAFLKFFALEKYDLKRKVYSAVTFIKRSLYSRDVSISVPSCHSLKEVIRTQSGLRSIAISHILL